MRNLVYWEFREWLKKTPAKKPLAIWLPLDSAAVKVRVGTRVKKLTSWKQEKSIAVDGPRKRRCGHGNGAEGCQAHEDRA
jgi:hypothetical protein